MGGLLSFKRDHHMTFRGFFLIASKNFLLNINIFRRTICLFQDGQTSDVDRNSHEASFGISRVSELFQILWYQSCKCKKGYSARVPPNSNIF